MRLELLHLNAGERHAGQIKDFSVSPSLLHGSVQRVSGEDLRDQLVGVRLLVPSHTHAANLYRGELAPVVLEEFFECGIYQFDASLSIEDDDPEWAILYQ